MHIYKKVSHYYGRRVSLAPESVPLPFVTCCHFGEREIVGGL